MRIISGRVLLPAVLAGVLGLAACGSSGGSSGGGGSAGGGSGGAGGSGTSSSSAAGGGAGTVAVRSTGKGKTLTDAQGHTLYVSDQEHGAVLCKSSACTAIWIPLTVAKGSTPMAPSGMSGTLSTLRRPDGKLQVALNGQPLYTFSFDHSAGSTAGDGQHDSFDGTNFTWHVATATGAAPAAPKSSGSSSTNNYPY